MQGVLVIPQSLAARQAAEAGARAVPPHLPRTAATRVGWPVACIFSMLAALCGCSSAHVHVSRADALRYGISAAAAAVALLPSASHASSLSPVGRDAALLYDTRSALFMPADPQRRLRTALDGGNVPRVFFAGEEHTHRLHHAMQLELIKAVDGLDGAPTLIGLEMCYRQQQPALDAFVFGSPERGGGDIDLLRRRTSWESTWGYPIELYAAILSYAREHRLRLCGLNAPYQVVQEVSRVGLSGLRPELRQMLPDVDLTNSDHRRRFAEAIGSVMPQIDRPLAAVAGGAVAGDAMHGPMDSGDFERMYEAMTLWDEFMASSIAGYVRPEPMMGAGPFGGKSLGTERMVVLVGSAHVRGRVGIPDRFAKRSKLATFTMVPARWEAAGRPAAEERLPPSEADWVLYTRPQSAREELSLVSARRLAREAIFL